MRLQRERRKARNHITSAGALAVEAQGNIDDWHAGMHASATMQALGFTALLSAITMGTTGVLVKSLAGGMKGLAGYASHSLIRAGTGVAIQGLVRGFAPHAAAWDTQQEADTSGRWDGMGESIALTVILSFLGPAGNDPAFGSEFVRVGGRSIKEFVHPSLASFQTIVQGGNLLAQTHKAGEGNASAEQINALVTSDAKETRKIVQSQQFAEACRFLNTLPDVNFRTRSEEVTRIVAKHMDYWGRKQQDVIAIEYENQLKHRDFKAAMPFLVRWREKENRTMAARRKDLYRRKPKMHRVEDPSLQEDYIREQYMDRAGNDAKVMFWKQMVNVYRGLENGYADSCGKYY